MDAATLKEKLIEQGWNLTSSALDLLNEKEGNGDIKAIEQKLLDIDLRKISQGTLPEDINRAKYDSLPGGIILQIQKVKNLSSPKYQESHNQNASIVKFVLSDGVLSVQAVALEPILSLHVNTLPGSKIYLTGEIEINHCFLLLSNKNTIFVGGRVEQLIEKWELNRKLAKHKRDNQEEGGPPPWIPFGQKIAKQILTDKNFKSLDQGKTKESSDNAEFEAQRKGAILEASKIGAVKVFGGGNNKLLDHNVQIIIEAGYSVEQAEYALKHSKNNPDRALKNLQARSAKFGKEDGATVGSKAGKVDEKGKGKGRGRHKDEDSASSLKPSGKVSLFDFLETKLPASEKEPSTPPHDSRNFADKRPNKSYKPGGEKTRSYNDEKRNNFDRSDGRSSMRRPEQTRGMFNHDMSERKPPPDRKPDVVRFDSKKSHEGNRNDKSFGNFKVKNEYFGAKNDTTRPTRTVDKRDLKPAQSQVKSYYNKTERTYDGPHEEGGRKSTSNFVQNNEKPPRFQKFQQQNQPLPNEAPIPQWNDNLHGRLNQQPDLQLQNNLANMTIQHNIVYANQNSFEHVGVPTNGNKNVFYQNVLIPSAQRADTHRPPPAQPIPVTSYHNPTPAGYIAPELKPSSYPGLPNVPDFPFKTNGTILPGFNEFQASFGSTQRVANASFSATNYNSTQNTFSNPANSYNSNAQSNYSHPPTYNNTPTNYNNTQTPFNNSQGNYNTPNPANNFPNFATPPTYISATQILQQPPPAPQPLGPTPSIHSQPSAPPAQPRRWPWEKGQKCLARYWEDQTYYNAVVTAVSDNTCVVKFTEYGNYEEVLQADCLPIPEMMPES